MYSVDRSEKVKYLSEITSFHITDAGYARLDEGWDFKINDAGENRLYIIHDGEGYVDYSNGKRVIMEKGRMYLLPVHTSGHFYCKYLIKTYINFKLSLFNSIDIFDFIKPKQWIEMKLFKDLTLLQKFPGNGIAEILRHQYETLLIIFDFFTESNNKNLETLLPVLQSFKELFEYINKNLSVKLSIKTLSALQNQTPYYLSVRFKKATGFSLKQYIIMQLIERSRYRLGFETAKVRDIAFELGFDDEFYFTKFFKRYQGCSPSEYRKLKTEAQKFT